MKRDPDKELALQLAYAYRSQRERWYGELRLVQSEGRDSAKGGYTWTVRKRGERGTDACTKHEAVPEMAAPSPVSSGSPETAGQGTNRTTEHGRKRPEHLQEAERHLQEAGNGIFAGQEFRADHTEDTEDGPGLAVTGDSHAHNAARTLHWRSDGLPAIGDGELGEDPAA